MTHQVPVEGQLPGAALGDSGEQVWYQGEGGTALLLGLFLVGLPAITLLTFLCAANFTGTAEGAQRFQQLVPFMGVLWNQAIFTALVVVAWKGQRGIRWLAIGALAASPILLTAIILGMVRCVFDLGQNRVEMAEIMTVWMPSLAVSVSTLVTCIVRLLSLKSAGNSP